MENHEKSFTGGWIQAIGTVLSAISSTPPKFVNKQQAEDLNIIGNLLQGTGNALAADSTDKVTLTKIGNMVQAIGNSIEVGAFLLTEGDLQTQLQIKGDLFQAVGGASAFADDLDSSPSREAALSLYGNLLQVIGNSLQALSGILSLRGQQRSTLDSVGSWIQAVGAILSALSASVPEDTLL
ncbi:DUF6944 family repetitive protein [Rossellomorea vietnamensis]|uniref:DUF6944 family repetitive protein n=1 Tax=Rossellomorea vietnamensis TaxID=218284 RepID=UPI003CEF69F4